jgi:hypothetical protein
MATTTNYGWTTPDDTDLVKDGAAAIRTLGTSIDTSFAADEGDLLVGGTSDIFEALSIGAAGTVLTSDGDTAEWAAPTAASQSFSLLNTGGTALTGATTVTVSGISGQNQLLVYVGGASSVTAGSIISLRLNTDTGTNYDQAQLQFIGQAAYSSANLNQQNLTAAAQIQLGQMADNAACPVAGTVMLFGCNSAGKKTYISMGGGNAFTNNHRTFIGGGVYHSTSTISSISIVSSTGNLDAGTVFVYGSA